MKYTFTFFAYFIYIFSVLGQSIELINTGFKNSFGKIQFPSANAIYILDDNTSTFLKSVDAGNTWDSIILPCDSMYYRYHGIQFTNETTGYIWGSAGSPFTYGLRPYILKTTDKGQSWNSVSDGLPQTGTMTGASFIDAQNGFCFLVCGDHSLNSIHNTEIYYTNNGGLSWNQNIIIPEGEFSSIEFINGDDGFATGHNNNLLFSKTQDGGTTWETKTLNKMGGSGTGIKFFSPTQGILFSNDSLFLTTDGGETWTKRKFPYSSNINSFAFYNDQVAYFISDNKIYKTTDGCQSWQLFHEDNNLFFADIKILNSFAYVTGTNGFVLKINMAEETSFVPSFVEKNNFLKIYPNPTNGEITISYEVRDDKPIYMDIYNVLGEKTMTLVNQAQTPGNHLIHLNLSTSQNGIYFIQSNINGITKTSKISKY